MSTHTFPGSPFKRAMFAAVAADVPVLTWGPPGHGKTASLKSELAAVGYHVEVFVGSQHESTDLTGLPIEVDGETRFAPSRTVNALNAAERSALYLDEFTTSPSSVMKTMLTLVQDREVGDSRLGPHVRIVASANPPECAVDGIELDPPVANRFLHLDFTMDVEAWLAGFAAGFEHMPVPQVRQMVATESVENKARARALVAAFLKQNSLIIKPDIPDNLGAPAARGDFAPSYAYPTPRSWDNLGKVLSRVHRDDKATISLVARGLVGEGAARQFTTWLDANDLYDPADVLDGTVTVAWATDSPDRLFALTSAISSIVANRAAQGSCDDTFKAALRVFEDAAKAGRPDVVVPAATAVLSVLPVTVAVPAGLREHLSDVVVRPPSAVRAAA